MKIKLFVTVIVSLAMVIYPVFAQKKLNNTFYVQNTLNGFKNAPQTALAKAKLLKTIGYDGLEGFGYNFKTRFVFSLLKFFNLLKTSKSTDLELIRPKPYSCQGI